MQIIEGGVTVAKGFEAAAAAAGIKYQDRTDMALIYSEKPCKVAGTFTTNLGKRSRKGAGNRREKRSGRLDRRDRNAASYGSCKSRDPGTGIIEKNWN